MGASAVVAGSLISGYMASQGAKSAAQTQADAARQAQQTQEQMLQQQIQAAAPYRAAGTQALGQLQAGFQPGGQFSQPFTLQQAALSPAEQAVQAQSMEAMRNQMQLGGQNLSTNAITGAGTLAGNLAGQFENQAFNQWMQQQQQQVAGLENLSGAGLSATGMATGQMGVAGQNIGSLQVGAGNAQAAGQVGSANAMAQGVTSGLQGAAQMYQLNQILGSGGGGTNVPGNTANFASSGPTSANLFMSNPQAFPNYNPNSTSLLPSQTGL